MEMPVLRSQSTGIALFINRILKLTVWFAVGDSGEV